MRALPIYKIQYYWGKAALILLMFHGAYGLWESFKFLVFEYPQLDNLLQQHILSEEKVIEIVAAGIFLMFATLISITMAWRLHNTTREDAATKIDLLIATCILVTAPFASAYLAQLPWLTWIENLLLYTL